MRTIYFITRTFADPNTGKSCTLVRNAYVDYFKQYFHVTVVTPSYNSESVINEDYIKINYVSKFVYPYMERIGLIEDYLDAWVDKTLDIVAERINSDDIIFATSGGELACIKLGSLLKERIGCKFIVNFHDPVDYSYVGNKKTCGFFHVNRENAILKYLYNVDYVITSSDKFREILQEKYSFLNNKIMNNYSGYILEYESVADHSEILRRRKAAGEKTRLVFGGSMNAPQGAEFFIHLLKKRSDIEIVYVGNPNKRIKKAAKMGNVIVLDPMIHSDYLRYMTENADIGLVSLAAEPYKACFPSKIYEYVNLEIPILAALPDGDAKKVINQYGYGRAAAYGNIEELNDAVEYILMHYDSNVKNIRKDKAKWSMKNRMKEVINLLLEV